jgi:hypothetical protein
VLGATRIVLRWSRNRILTHRVFEYRRPRPQTHRTTRAEGRMRGGKEHPDLDPISARGVPLSGTDRAPIGGAARTAVGHSASP